MAEATLFKFSHKEVAEALLKQQGIHEGLWTLVVNFAVTISNIGPQNPDSQLNPGIIATVEGIGLQRAKPGEEQRSLTVDAAQVNPR